ncbi:hypothetical protein G6F57_010604 [Rhizopus arrhizus]|uniref:Uncharacterized protein n=1 Tax=Rhizopus oryzae TaxID=64495 RepID=A0A9P6WZJ6_RHIOR|nr:hypothetical protein G6F23_007230 [Rhizopus arrhizus]KAG1406244.1 hypothetical protein G6F58_009869 [Rhizopus delemar]KAG0755801.1 hypothetical protein G6F24_011588 [Rhizopus arrhizus]KAG0774640.1 hypothetical protein G6F22_013904 [Rhizopus arrhizus]KAG0781990.1 hypothetical protein G6F21_011351 [Rhizopus arrhizus]
MGQYKCCCCIPIRAGVLIIALLSAAFYVAITVLLSLAIPKFSMFSSTNELALTYGLLLLIDESESAFSTTAVKGVHYTSIAITVIFAFCSLFGVIGSITQHRKMIAAFKLAYWTSSLLELLISIAAIIVLAVQRIDIINTCAALNADETVGSCSSYYRTFMIILCCLIVIVNLFQFYFAAAISSYATRLRRTNMHEKLRHLEDFPEAPRKVEFF